MAPRKRFAERVPTGAGVAAFCVLAVLNAHGDDGKAAQKAPSVTLSVAEANAVRSAVYEKGIRTSISSSGPASTQRVLSVPSEVRECHTLNRVGTLRILADIVKGGRPRDALVAMCYVIALEESPAVAALYAAISQELIDQEGRAASKSLRPEFVVKCKTLIESAEKEIPKAK
jgi:hypothetical protein